MFFSTCFFLCIFFHFFFIFHFSISVRIIYLVCGGFLIFTFADDFIESVVQIASSLNVSPTLLAFFLSPIASEAPEILEAVQLSRHELHQIGNRMKRFLNENQTKRF